MKMKLKDVTPRSKHEPLVKIKKPWDTISEQQVNGDNGEVWKITDIIEKAKDLPVKDMPLDHLCLDFKIGGIKVREFVAHMKLIFDTDMKYPVILDQDGHMFDGRHRMAKALFEEHRSIKAVRFEEDPAPTFYKTDK